jgi:hypothetical protein
MRLVMPVIVLAAGGGVTAFGSDWYVVGTSGKKIDTS